MAWECGHCLLSGSHLTKEESTLGKDPTGAAWLLIGLFNLIAALGAFLIGGGSTNP